MKTRFLISFITILFISNSYSQTIGLQLHSLREQFKKDVPGTLAKVKSWGIREIEGGGTYGLPLEDFKKLLTQNGLTMIATGADFQQLSDNPQAAADNAKAFGAKYVVCYWIPHDGDNFTITEITKAIDVFNKAGKVMFDNGLSLCYHPHGFEMRPYENGILFDQLVKNTDPRYFNFEMDVYWIKQSGQDPVALLKKYPKRFLLLHLKDRKNGTEGNMNGKGDIESNVVLGSGDVEIAAVMKEAKKIGIKHYFIEDESSISEEQIPKSLSFLKTLK